MQRILLPLGLVAALAACNQGSDLERAAIGAAVGCAAGEILSNGRCIVGGAIGAAAGALANDI